MSFKDSLLEEFSMLGLVADDDVVNKCEIICNQHGIDGEDLAVHWLTYATNNGYSNLTSEALESFEKEYLSKKKNSAPSSVIKSRTPKVVSAAPAFNDDDLIISAYSGSPAPNKLKSLIDKNKTPRRINSPITPRSGISSTLRKSQDSPIPQGLSPNVSRRSQRFIGRSNAGDIVLTYKTENGEVNLSNKVWNAKPCQVEITVSGVEDSIENKMMFDKLCESGDMEEDAVLHVAEEIAPAFGGEDCWHYMDNTSNIPINSVGRICCDSNGKLNAASVLMEGTRKYAGAVMQRLDFSNLDKFAVFPGQVVGVSGINITGERLIVDNLVGGRILPFSETPITISDSTGPVQLAVACGPFTTSDNLLFEPLLDLLSSILTEPPHILLLLGPILDANHPLLSESSNTETYQDIVNRVLNMIAAAVTKMSTEVYIVSSHKDVTSTGVYPTFPLIGVPRPRLHLVSDPSMLEVEGVVIAVTTMDVIMDLSKEELAFPPSQGDRMSRLVQHILAQQSLYPLHPPPSHVCVSPLLLQKFATVNCKPHVLIVPSDIRHFVKEVSECVAVNPERLCKGTSGGFYARIELDKPSSENAFRPNITAAIYRV